MNIDFTNLPEQNPFYNGDVSSDAFHGSSIEQALISQSLQHPGVTKATRNWKHQDAFATQWGMGGRYHLAPTATNQIPIVKDLRDRSILLPGQSRKLKVSWSNIGTNVIGVVVITLVVATIFSNQ